MKKISLLLILLVLLLCGCSQIDIPLPGTQATTADAGALHEHLFRNEVVTREARCTEVGFKTATCACGATEETLIPATGHTFGEAVITKQPTCIETGEKTITCSACGATEKTSISATGKHIYGEAVVTTEPTCIKDGEKTAACTTCNATKKTTVPATGKHIYGEAVVTKQPTCVKEGEKTATCTTCDATEKTVILAKGHTFGEAVVTTDPTCVAEGEKTATCACGAVEKTSVPATGKHIFGEAIVTTDPTCVEDGEKTATCATCDAVEKTTISATGNHTFGEAIITKQPTCAEDGEKTATCSVCGATERTTVPATRKHIYGDAVITKEPTCIEAGLISTTCSVCGDEKQTPIFPSDSDHIYQNGLCLLCGKSPIPLYLVPSIYDADGDGENDFYNFSPELLDTYQYGIHVWAAQYDKTLSDKPSSSSVGNGLHWYVPEFSEKILVFKVTVPETGVYEMVINVCLMDSQVRGTKYTVNGGTDNEQIFETSYGYPGMNYIEMRNDTYGAYMYGVTVNLLAGENTIQIEHAPDCPKSQNYRHFYFVKVGEYHAHSFSNKTVIKHATCSDVGECVATCSCGETRVTVIPPTYEHHFVNGVCTECGKEYGITEYDFLYDNPGFAGGTLTFLPETSDVYTFYWADANGRLQNYTMLYSDEFVEGMEAEVTIQSFTAIPKGATRLLAVSGDGDVTYSYTIPADRLMTKDELYVFGALSDTHQGTRYGSTDIPYNHFVNAAKVLYEKGAITVGICGDFSYLNVESEYILHANAIREIYGFAPDMPIFTTTGNHESRDPYPFNKEMYLEYTRDLVDYDSDLYYIFSDGNNLDYVIELPDGSVMIFFHQVYYQYGSSTSRLVTDAQLDWLGARFEQYKDRTVFFFFHTFMDEQVGDASTPGNEYGLPMISSTVEYKKFDEYFKKYTNVVYFSGHSHWAFDSQFVDPKPGKTNYDKNIDDKDGTYATMVHIPACSTPRTLVGSGDGRSEGYIVYVYEDCVVFMGYEFVKDETFAYATYIIEK